MTYIVTSSEGEQFAVDGDRMSVRQDGAVSIWLKKKRVAIFFMPSSVLEGGSQ